MATDLSDLTALELAEQLGTRAVSPVEVIRAVQARLDATEPFLNAYLLRLDDDALAAAQAAEREIGAGHYRGPLHGVPVAIKDNIDVAGTNTTAGTKVLANNLADEDAEVVRRLRAAGAIVVGKTNMTEMALGPRSLNAHYGNIRNPWGPNHDAGGSSGGSAASVAARQVPVALGTDAGGSVRIPAAATGLVGLKQTHGLVSSRGMVASGNVTVDHIGPFGRTVADVALMLEAMAGYDPRDPTSADQLTPSYRAALRADLDGVRVGVPTAFFFDLVDPEVEAGVRAAIEVLAARGATLVPVTIPDLEPLMQARTGLTAEGLAFHDPYLRESPELYSDDLRRRLLANYFIPARDHARSNRARRLLKERFAAAFAEVDLLATPGCVAPAPALSDETVSLKDFRTGALVDVPITQAMTRMTALFNSTGLPAVCVPAGFTAAGLPISLQIVGRAFEDALVLGAAHAYEQATDWHRRRAPFVMAPAGSA